MSKFNVKSYNKYGKEVRTSDLILEDENMYRILRKYIRKTENDIKITV